VVQNLALRIDVVQNIVSLNTRDAKYCLLGCTWCKILPLSIHMVLNIASLNKRGTKIFPL
jgi:hypothetical protein